MLNSRVYRCIYINAVQMIIPTPSVPKSPNHLHQHRWLGRHERPVPLVETHEWTNEGDICLWWVFLCQPIHVIVGQMWRNSNLRFFGLCSYDIHNSIILVAWFLPKKLNNYAQVELDRLLKKWGFFTKLLGVSTTTCDQSLPSLPAKSEDKSPTSSKQGGNLIRNQLWVTFLTISWHLREIYIENHRNNEQIPPTSNGHEIGE